MSDAKPDETPKVVVVQDAKDMEIARLQAIVAQAVRVIPRILEEELSGWNICFYGMTSEAVKFHKMLEGKA